MRTAHIHLEASFPSDVIKALIAQQLERILPTERRKKIAALSTANGTRFLEVLQQNVQAHLYAWAIEHATEVFTQVRLCVTPVPVQDASIPPIFHDSKWTFYRIDPRIPAFLVQHREEFWELKCGQGSTTLRRATGKQAIITLMQEVVLQQPNAQQALSYLKHCVAAMMTEHESHLKNREYQDENLMWNGQCYRIDAIAAVLPDHTVQLISREAFESQVLITAAQPRLVDRSAHGLDSFYPDTDRTLLQRFAAWLSKDRRNSHPVSEYKGLYRCGQGFVLVVPVDELHEKIRNLPKESWKWVAGEDGSGHVEPAM